MGHLASHAVPEEGVSYNTVGQKHATRDSRSGDTTGKTERWRLGLSKLEFDVFQCERTKNKRQTICMYDNGNQDYCFRITDPSRRRPLIAEGMPRKMVTNRTEIIDTVSDGTVMTEQYRYIRQQKVYCQRRNTGISTDIPLESSLHGLRERQWYGVTAMSKTLYRLLQAVQQRYNQDYGIAFPQQPTIIVRDRVFITRPPLTPLANKDAGIVLTYAYRKFIRHATGSYRMLEGWKIPFKSIEDGTPNTVSIDRVILPIRHQDEGAGTRQECTRQISEPDTEKIIKKRMRRTNGRLIVYSTTKTIGIPLT